VRLTLLGTGAAAGLPVYGCECNVCSKALAKPALRRTPCSALLQLGEQCFLIDAGQVNLAERFPAGTLSAICLTHFHPDHVQGLFHLRWGTNVQIPVYTPPDSQGCADLYKHPGILAFQTLRKFTPFTLGSIVVTPVPLIHSKPTFGYCFDVADQRIAYLTDTKGLPPATEEFLCASGVDLLIVDCSYPPGTTQAGHNNLDDVLSLLQRVQPRSLVLTHIGHAMDQWLLKHADSLPAQVQVGRDGAVVFEHE